MIRSAPQFHLFRLGARRGFTLLEIVIVLLVISILSLLLIQNYKSLEARAARTRCASNLRNLHIALAAYTQDQNHWPQCPFELGDEGFDDWWIKEMSRYKLGRSNWECPTCKQIMDAEAGKKEGKKEDKAMIHYVPTPFDDGARTPYKWRTQPWAVEIGDFHGDGNLIVFPDGTIRGFNQYAAER
ncbi:MAG TPA: prepilin-type N-terminal cleavage/methylation domain-containing protein [Chthoniobacteraceae bacterium]|nr:prepilin-type N-terminal cleavage/methylation domain-containing protein [Chthoniobacteraceae bacterium]